MGTPKYRGRRDRTMDDKLMYPQNLYPNSGLNKQEGYFRLFITLVPFYNNVISLAQQLWRLLLNLISCFIKLSV